jgi:decaprenyl-phosphate phosphoribosyltransferase
VTLSPYIRMARPSHWFKNLFMLPGVLLVFFFDPGFRAQASLAKILLGAAAACLVASSNYVLNEILDAPFDRFHPTKAGRPIVIGQVPVWSAVVEWLLLAVVGFGIAAAVGPRFLISAAALWVMGILYNAPPIRLKDVPYADVLSESINNPIRMAMGWYSTGYGSFPTLSVVLAYWMFGAFLMATKRLAEFRMIADRPAAERYRRSFRFYTEERLLSSIVFYASLFAMFSGVFIARYRLELILATPFICLAMARYLQVGFERDSPAQRPERLYTIPGLVGLILLAAITSAILLFADIPLLARIFRQWYQWPR